MESQHIFHQHRGYLRGLAYRMLGSVSDAEDIVQDAYLRWHSINSASIDNPQAWLTTVVSRLCLDRLGEARRKREIYVGPWLPEPLVDNQENNETAEGIACDVSFALMLALERLSPLERAVLILHDFFDLSFCEVADALGRSEASCRQLAKRARSNVHLNKPRFHFNKDDNARLVAAFFQASREGDIDALKQLLVDTVVFHSDGGGQRTAALRLIRGIEKVCRLFRGLSRKANRQSPLWTYPCEINGEAGLLTLEHDGYLQVTTIHIENGLITDIYIIRNPQKLKHLLHLVPANMRGLTNTH